MRPIKRKTYTNFISIMNYLVREKHYTEREAERLTSSSVSCSKMRRFSAR